MQIMIDTATDTPEQISTAARLLLAFAGVTAADDTRAPAPPPIADTEIDTTDEAPKARRGRTKRATEETAAPLAVPPPPAAPSAVTESVPQFTPPLDAPTPVEVAPPPPVVYTPVDFKGLMHKIQTHTASGKLTHDAVVAAMATVGLKPEEMAKLIKNDLLIASVNAAIEAALA